MVPDNMVPHKMIPDNIFASGYPDKMIPSESFCPVKIGRYR